MKNIILFILLLSTTVIADEALNPEALPWLEIKPNLKAEDNGFIYFYGIRKAVKPEETWETGYRYQRELENIFNYNLHHPRAQKSYPSMDGLDFVEDPLLCTYEVVPEIYQDCCDKQYCYQSYTTLTSEQLAYLIEKYQTHLAHYKKLQTYNAFEALIPPSISTPFPNYTAITQAHNAVILTIIQDYKNGKKQQAVEILTQDIAFHRARLQDKDTLIGKLIWINLLANDLYTLATLINIDPQFINLNQAPFTELLQPLTPEETALDAAFQYEFQTSFFLMRDVLQLDPGLSSAQVKFIKIFFQQNQTINKIYTMYRYIVNLSLLDSQTFYQKYPSEEEVSAIFKATGLEKIFNYIGNVLLDISLPSYVSYIIRIHNISGLMVLVKAQASIQQQAISSENIQDFLNNHPEFYNIYTHAPLFWNTEKQSLSFKTPDDVKKYNELVIFQ